eukprot:11611406-Prorocentrum_lima.AAC.1
MTSSLVGSEMCIRDSYSAPCALNAAADQCGAAALASGGGKVNVRRFDGGAELPPIDLVRFGGGVALASTGATGGGRSRGGEREGSRRETGRP